MTLRPARPLLRQSILGLALGSSLVFAVLYWLAFPSNLWGFVLTVHVGLVVLATAIARQFLRAHVALTPDGVSERGLNGHISKVQRGRVRLVLIIDLYQHHSAETLPHLFIADTEGRLLLRMRGQYWPPEDMEKVAAHLAAPVQRPRQPVSRAELHATSPELLYWFERPYQLGRVLSPWVSPGRPVTRRRRRRC